MSNFITSIRGGFRGRGRGFGDTGRGSDFGDPDSGCARSPSRQRQRSPVQQILRNRLDDVEAPGSFTYSYSLPRRSRGNPLSPRGVARDCHHNYHKIMGFVQLLLHMLDKLEDSIRRLYVFAVQLLLKILKAIIFGHLGTRGDLPNPFNNHGPIHASTPSFSCHSTIPAQTTLVPNVLHQRMTVQPLVHIRSNPAVPGISLVSVNTAGFNNTMQTVSVINPLVPRTPAPDLRYAPPNAVSEVGTSKNSNLNELKSHTTNSQSPASVVVKPQPPPPPKIGGSRMEPTKEPVDMDSVSYELQFIDLSNSYNLDVKSSPSIKIDENGKKTFAFTIEDKWPIKPPKPHSGAEKKASAFEG
ncbi:unnamed protein product [Allacma fusca]|uniref:Uncharacterized protein n=1 Tax=Allacma fusca TaxID=39272 RepID=A0A8J2NRL2_9HEXA|nr:unnamed protein product [Allacma fusca]